jgi:hypothetical protein
MAYRLLCCVLQSREPVNTLFIITLNVTPAIMLYLYRSIRETIKGGYVSAEAFS